MKFRAAIREDIYIKEFLSILTTMAKQERQVIVNLSKRGFSVLSCCDDFDTAPIIWVDVPQNMYFSEFEFDFKPPEYDQIYFIIDSRKLLQSFAGFQNAVNYLKMKLSSNPWEALVLATEVPGKECNHKKRIELPVCVVSRKNWQQYELPTNQAYDMTAQLTYLRPCTAAVSTLRNLSHEFLVEIEASGMMQLYVEDDEFTTRVKIKDLNVVENNVPETEDEASSDSEDRRGQRRKSVVCKVNSKRVAAMLANNAFKNAPGSISLRQDQRFKLNIDIRENRVIMHFVLPAMYRETFD